MIEQMKIKKTEREVELEAENEQLKEKLDIVVSTLDVILTEFLM